MRRQRDRNWHEPHPAADGSHLRGTRFRKQVGRPRPPMGPPKRERRPAQGIFSYGRLENQPPVASLDNKGDRCSSARLLASASRENPVEERKVEFGIDIDERGIMDRPNQYDVPNPKEVEASRAEFGVGGRDSRLSSVDSGNFEEDIELGSNAVGAGGRVYGRHHHRDYRHRDYRPDDDYHRPSTPYHIVEILLNSSGRAILPGINVSASKRQKIICESKSKINHAMILLPRRTTQILEKLHKTKLN